jgi:hypothetical protein
MKAKFWALLMAGLGVVSIASAGGWHGGGYGVADRWSSVAYYDGASNAGYYGGNCAGSYGYGGNCGGSVGYGGNCSGYDYGSSCSGYGGGWGHHHHHGGGDCCGAQDYDDDCDD